MEKPIKVGDNVRVAISAAYPNSIGMVTEVTNVGDITVRYADGGICKFTIDKNEINIV